MSSFTTQVVSHISCDTSNAAAVARALQGLTAQVRSNFGPTFKGTLVMALGCTIENFAVVPDGVVATFSVSYKNMYVESDTYSYE